MTLLLINRVLRLISQYCWPITVAAMALITLLSLTPLAHLPDAPGSDKAHHLIAYAALSFPIAARGGPKWMLLLPFFILWGGAIELLQPYVNRYAEWFDFAANSLGVLLGAGVGLLARRL
jgi:VanZ family protein